MAKCVRDKKGNIKRVSNDEAARLVASGAYVYESKSAWKKQRSAVENQSDPIRESIDREIDAAYQMSEAKKLK